MQITISTEGLQKPVPDPGEGEGISQEQPIVSSQEPEIPKQAGELVRVCHPSGAVARRAISGIIPRPMKVACREVVDIELATVVRQRDWHLFRMRGFGWPILGIRSVPIRY